MSTLEKKLLSDPATSNRLKEQIKLTKELDVVDVINETEALLFILKQRFFKQTTLLTSLHS